MAQPNANTNEINKRYSSQFKAACSESDKSYDNIKEIIDMLILLIPYRRTMCIGSNMVVLNDKYMRDNIEMTSFKFGGKIKVLGYITNEIDSNSDEEETDYSPKEKTSSPIADIDIGINQMMLSFFSQQGSLKVIHPIAIYYE